MLQFFLHHTNFDLSRDASSGIDTSRSALNPRHPAYTPDTISLCHKNKNEFVNHDLRCSAHFPCFSKITYSHLFTKWVDALAHDGIINGECMNNCY